MQIRRVPAWALADFCIPTSAPHPTAHVVAAYHQKRAPTWLVDGGGRVCGRRVLHADRLHRQAGLRVAVCEPCESCKADEEIQEAAHGDALKLIRAECRRNGTLGRDTIPGRLPVAINRVRGRHEPGTRALVARKGQENWATLMVMSEWRWAATTFCTAFLATGARFPQHTVSSRGVQNARSLAGNAPPNPCHEHPPGWGLHARSGAGERGEERATPLPH